MRTSPFFSVVIPTLDEELVLPSLLDDLKNQTFRDFEVFVVDGQSRDNTPNIVRKASKSDRHFHLLLSPTRNVGTQRNVGGRKARGTYILFLDADNRVSELFLKGLHYNILRTGCDACTTYTIPDTNHVQDKMLTKSINQLVSLSNALNRPMVVLGTCLSCSKRAFDSLGGFDETITYAEDLDFVRRLAKEYSFKVFTHPTFTVSLRRFRKEGTLNMYRKVVPLALKLLLEGKVTEETENYPMKGGSFYFDLNDQEKKRVKADTQSVRKLKNLLRSTRSLAKTSERKIRKAFDLILKELE